MTIDVHATAVATDKAGATLYCVRNWRMGGKRYQIETPDGTVRDHTKVAAGGRYAPKPATAGRWTWKPETEWAR